MENAGAVASVKVSFVSNLDCTYNITLRDDADS